MAANPPLSSQLDDYRNRRNVAWVKEVQAKRDGTAEEYELAYQDRLRLEGEYERLVAIDEATKQD